MWPFQQRPAPLLPLAAFRSGPSRAGATGLTPPITAQQDFERAEAQRQRLQAANLTASVRQELGDDWTPRLGPLTHSAAWTAIEAFIDPPNPCMA